MVYRFYKKEYIPVSNPRGGDGDISSFDEDKPGGPSKCDSDI